MKKKMKKLTICRETLRTLGHEALHRVAGRTGESEVVSACASDTFPPNCRETWNCAEAG